MNKRPNQILYNRTNPSPYNKRIHDPLLSNFTLLGSTRVLLKKACAYKTYVINMFRVLLLINRDVFCCSLLINYKQTLTITNRSKLFVDMFVTLFLRFN